MKFRNSMVMISVFLILAVGCSGIDPDATGLIRLDEGVYALIAGGGTFEENLGANRGFVVGSQGVLVIDAGYTPEHAEIFLEKIREITDLPVKYLVNTHYHPVNVWGNSVFGEKGAVIVARPETARQMERSFQGYLEYYRGSNPQRYRDIKDVQLTLPDSVMYEERLVLDLGGREVILRHFGPAHTAGDCLVSVPESGVLFAGGIVSRGYHPNMADPDADLRNWLDIVDSLRSERFEYIVPGEGGVSDAGQLDLQEAYIENLMEVCADSIRRGVPLRRLVNTLQPAEIIPEAADYLHRNIFSFNVRAVFLAEVPRVVKPDFELELPEGFRIGGGGGGRKVGRMHWFRDLALYEEIEVQWQPTGRDTVLAQDIYARAPHFKTSSAERKMKILGDRKIDLGGEEVTAVHGRWAESIKNLGTRGFWTMAMAVRDGKLYTINCLVRAGRDDEIALNRLRRLEGLLADFSLKER